MHMFFLAKMLIHSLKMLLIKCKTNKGGKVYQNVRVRIKFHAKILMNNRVIDIGSYSQLVT